jgi:NitT/TauT family transport system substrate-binding protein
MKPRRRNAWRYVLATAAAGALLVLSACGSSNSSSGGMPTVKLGMPVNGLEYSGVLLADELGYFKDAGVNVKITSVESGAGTVTALIGKDVDMAVVIPDNVVTADDQGVKPSVKMFANLASERGSTMVIKTKIAQERGITADEPLIEKLQKMKGLKFGVSTIGSGGDVNLRQMLAYAGLNPEKDVTITAVGSSSAMLPAFVAGRIDAFPLSAPQPEVAAAQGKGTIVVDLSTGEFPDIKDVPYAALAATSTYLSKNADVVQKVTNAVQRALEYLKDNPDQAGATLKAANYPDLSDDVWQQTMGVTEREVGDSGTLMSQTGTEKLIQLLKAKVSFNDVATTKFANAAIADSQASSSPAS